MDGKVINLQKTTLLVFYGHSKWYMHNLLKENSIETQIFGDYMMIQACQPNYKYLENV